VRASSVHSEAFGINQLLAFDDQLSYFASNVGESEWLEFRFNGGEIRLTHYVLRGWRNARAGVCPVSWILQGNNGSDEWFTLDEQKENKALMLNNEGPVLFAITRMTGSCMAVRFEQRATGTSENQRLVLSGIEFYGIWHES
jgi:hypothetical protein